MTEPRPDLRRVSPAELADGEDRLWRFRREAEAVQTLVTDAAEAEVPAAVVSALAASAPGPVALTADLGDLREPVAAALRDAGWATHGYERVAGDREVVRGLVATVTGCLAAVAATGSVVTGGAAGRAGALVAPLHVAVVREAQIVDGLSGLLRVLPSLGGGSGVALQSGPSRTADIEKTLILGMHGPKAVHVVLVPDG